MQGDQNNKQIIHWPKHCGGTYV